MRELRKAGLAIAITGCRMYVMDRSRPEIGNPQLSGILPHFR